MITDITPITNLKLTILSELYQRDLNLTNLEKRTNSLKQTLFKTLKSLNNVLNKENGVYSLKPEYKLILKSILIQKLLENRLKSKYIVLNLIKKYYNPEKIILFGSYAKGEMNKDSDIDIYVISKLDEETNINNTLKFSKSLNIDIQIININPEIHLTKKDNYSELYNKISDNIKEGIQVDINTIL